MIKFSSYINEEEKKSVKKTKHYFDIDETLFAHDKNKLRIHVKDPSGNRVQTLTNQEFNSHQLPPGHNYDFSEFRSSDVFQQSATPIHDMVDKMTSMKKDGHDVEMLTAREDFDDKKKFAQVMNKYGIDITPGSGIHVRRAGNISGDKPSVTKALHVADAIKKEGLSEIHLYDDSLENIKGVMKLKKQFPDVDFHGYHVQHDPESGKTNIDRY